MSRKLVDFIKGRKCMCLDSVAASLEKSTLVESGFKTFASNPPRFENVAWHGKMEVPLDHWITAEEKNIGQYSSGFHIYTREKELSPGFANKRRVYFRNAHTSGRQGGKTVVVAKEMYVPSDPDAWPPR